MCFMEHLVSALHKIQPRGGLVNILGELIKNKYLLIRLKVGENLDSNHVIQNTIIP